ncbi:hypothetical protein V6N11_020818 [Hibiscus sabdariffa]|uniref:RNase H type-1 domain-containing protein n=1 Tax=Hibiscus sabdariffa TaxID=183260 RepID=A0ABR2Q9W8_9ROSI
MVVIPPPLPHFGSDVPGWDWDEKREFRLSSTYAFLIKAVDRNRSSKWCKIWALRICINHICRYRNGVADKLASLGLHQTMEWVVFAVPPGAVEVLVANEKQQCEERLFGAESTTPICKRVDPGG